MGSRYSNRIVAINNHPFYRKYLKDSRDRDYIEQYRSPSFLALTEGQIANLTIVGHIWSTGDRYWKLSSIYYGDPNYWWAIAFFNNAPTEGHVKIGSIVDIPTPLETVLQYMKV